MVARRSRPSSVDGRLRPAMVIQPALLESGDAFGSAGRDFFVAEIGLEQVRAQPEARRARLAPFRHIGGAGATDRIDRHILGQHRQHRLEMIGAAGRGRKQFQDARARRDGREAFAGGEEARHHRHALFHAARDHRRIGVGRHQQLAAGIHHPVDILRRQHRARARQATVAKGLGQRFDAREGLRRIERHFDGADARFIEHMRYAFDARRQDAAQDRDKGSSASRASGFMRIFPYGYGPNRPAPPGHHRSQRSAHHRARRDYLNKPIDRGRLAAILAATGPWSRRNARCWWSGSEERPG